MKKLMQSLRMVVTLILMCGLIFPLVLTGVANLVFPNQAQGSLIVEGEAVVGSRLIAQDFHDDRYLSGRPYLDQAGVSGSNNWAVGSETYEIELKQRIEVFLSKNPTVSIEQIPMELITESGSSLDPHISVAGALIQIDRMHALNQIEKSELESIIKNHTNSFGLVNVLEANLEIYTLLR